LGQKQIGHGAYRASELCQSSCHCGWGEAVLLGGGKGVEEEQQIAPPTTTMWNPAAAITPEMRFLPDRQGARHASPWPARAHLLFAAVPPSPAWTSCVAKKATRQGHARRRKEEAPIERASKGGGGSRTGAAPAAMEAADLGRER
jgi:hypothetical protein